MIPFETPAYSDFLTSALVGLNSRNLNYRFKDVIERFKRGEIQFVTAVDRLYAILPPHLWARFTRLFCPALALTEVEVKKLSRGVWNVRTRRQGASPMGVLGVPEIAAAVIRYLQPQAAFALASTCRWANAQFTPMQRVMAHEQWVRAFGQYERGPGLSLRVHNVKGTAAVWISLPHREVPVVCLMTDQQKRYIVMDMAEYHIRCGDHFEDIQLDEERKVRLSEVLDELFRYVDLGYTDIRMWFEPARPRAIGDLGITLYVVAPLMYCVRQYARQRPEARVDLKIDVSFRPWGEGW